MSNPCRYFINDSLAMRPQWDHNKKEITLILHEELAEIPQTMKIDFYSAPDVISRYANGNSCEDEFRRYGQHILKNVHLIEKDVDLIDEYIYCTFSYDEIESKCFTFGDPECETNIPLGKFKGMTYQQVQNYKRVNRPYGQNPEPSSEAIQAAYEAQPLSEEYRLSLEDIKIMLLAAYKLDM